MYHLIQVRLHNPDSSPMANSQGDTDNTCFAHVVEGTRTFKYTTNEHGTLWYRIIGSNAFVFTPQS